MQYNSYACCWSCIWSAISVTATPINMVSWPETCVFGFSRIRKPQPGCTVLSKKGISILYLVTQKFQSWHSLLVLQSYMDSEIRAIMAQYMPLDSHAEVPSHVNNAHAWKWQAPLMIFKDSCGSYLTLFLFGVKVEAEFYICNVYRQ